jgi:hypothetical protein
MGIDIPNKISRENKTFPCSIQLTVTFLVLFQMIQIEKLKTGGYQQEVNVSNFGGSNPRYNDK